MVAISKDTFKNMETGMVSGDMGGGEKIKLVLGWVDRGVWKICIVFIQNIKV